EQGIENPRVLGSIPSPGTTIQRTRLMAGFCFSGFCKNKFSVPAGYNHNQLCALPAQQVISFRCFAAYRSVNTVTFVLVISFLRRDFPVFYLSSHLFLF
ncbi:MAG: hypothetical protein KHY92_06785, partial [Morganella morganii]|nr:hypothetical protein [Morganella morganii]